MSMSINQFKARGLPGGGARANLFRVRGSFPSEASGILSRITNGGAIDVSAISNILNQSPEGKLEFLCKAAQIPGQTLGVIEVPRMGRILKVPGDRTFDDWTITIIEDTDYAIRDAFESWSNLINSHEANIGTGSLQAIQQNWTIEHLDKSGSVIKQYEMESCFPQVIEPIEVSYDSADTIAEYNVTMSYQFWRARTTS